MRSRFTVPKTRRKHITSADVGRYVKHLAALHRDPLTGNPAMSEALSEIADILMSGKAAPARRVLEDHVSQKGFEFEQDTDLHSLPLDDVKTLLSRADLTKSDLVMVGSERFGIAKSRMDRIPREEIVSAISSAIQHEESLSIISEEARRHTRTS